MIKDCQTSRGPPKPRSLKEKRAMVATWSDNDSSHENNQNEEIGNLCLMVIQPSNTSCYECERATERAKGA